MQESLATRHDIDENPAQRPEQEISEKLFGRKDALAIWAFVGEIGDSRDAAVCAADLLDAGFSRGAISAEIEKLRSLGLLRLTQAAPGQIRKYYEVMPSNLWPFSANLITAVSTESRASTASPADAIHG